MTALLLRGKTGALHVAALEHDRWCSRGVPVVVRLWDALAGALMHWLAYVVVEPGAFACWTVGWSAFDLETCVVDRMRRLSRRRRGPLHNRGSTRAGGAGACQPLECASVDLLIDRASVMLVRDHLGIDRGHRLARAS